MLTEARRLITIGCTIFWSGDPGLYKINKLGAFIHLSLPLNTSGSCHFTWSTASCTVPRLFNFMRSHLWIVGFNSQVTEVLFRRPTKVCSTCFWNLGKREGLTTGISVKVTFMVSLHEEADVTLLLFLESCHSRSSRHTYSSRRHQRWASESAQSQLPGVYKTIQRWPAIDLRQWENIISLEHKSLIPQEI